MPFWRTGTFLFRFGSYGTADGQFDNPRGLVVDRSGNILVADTGNHRIQVFDSQGNFLSSFGSFGSGLGELAYPVGLGLTPTGDLVVAEPGNHRVQVFDGPPPPQHTLQSLRDSTDTLVTAGTLRQGDGNALTAKLDATINSLDRGNTTSACNQLRAFINQTHAFINSGGLTTAQGHALIDAADAVRAQTGC